MQSVSDDRPGHPFLAFLNTVRDDGKTRRLNSFDTPEDLIARLDRAGLRIGGPPPNRGQLDQALMLRETAYATLSAMAAGRRPGREDALDMETAIKAVLVDGQFRFSKTGLDIAPGPLAGLHDVLVLSLIDLLRSPAIGRLRECRRCTHLFLDHGRGPGRHWCSMARCGNRAKSESFRRRQKAGPG